MAKETLESFNALILGQSPFIEVADGWNGNVVTLFALLASDQVCGVDLPLCNLWLPVAASHLLVEARLIVNIILPSQARPVSLNLLTLGKSFRPLRVGFKAGLIDVGGNITSNARVDVLEPRTALSKYSEMAEKITEDRK